MKRDDRLLTLVAIAIGLLLWSLLPACALRRPALPPAPTGLIPPKAPAEAPPADRREAADARVAALQGQLDQAETEAAQLRRAERDARYEGVRRLVTWACALAALVGIVGAGLAVYLRSSAMAMIPVACAAMVAMGMTTNVILDHPVLTVLGLAGIVGVLALVPTLRHRALLLAQRVTT